MRADCGNEYSTEVDNVTQLRRPQCIAIPLGQSIGRCWARWPLADQQVAVRLSSAAPVDANEVSVGGPNWRELEPARGGKPRLGGMRHPLAVDLWCIAERFAVAVRCDAGRAAIGGRRQIFRLKPEATEAFGEGATPWVESCPLADAQRPPRA